MNKKNLNHFIPFDAFFLFFFSQSIIYWHNGAIVIRPLVAAKLLRPVAARAVYVDINTKKNRQHNMKKMTAMITHIINSACSCFVCLNQRVCVCSYSYGTTFVLETITLFSWITEFHRQINFERRYIIISQTQLVGIEPFTNKLTVATI